ncbi:endonuclease/exonuclease/phosphatase family protein [Streptosporangium saharense]|uniref:endonuclease/exonuclease/phosphatase family protein n=1 Tax=Streptosporangium saharense TaxID=1706840 RepID=UPI00343D2DA3
MSYNILMGGNRSSGDRTDLLLSVMKDLAPDIVGLCECAGFTEDDNRRLRLFADTLGMIGIINEASSENHVAMLYKESLNASETYTKSVGLYNGMARVVVPTAVGDMAVVMTHLHPFSSTFRLGEAEVVSVRAAFAPNSIIMGDLNSLSRAALPDDLSGLSRTFQIRALNSVGEIDTAPIDLLLSRGWVDLAGENVHPTYPTILKGSQEESDRSARLDYMFATPDLAERCQSFTVVASEQAHRASDHLPLVADFEI